MGGRASTTSRGKLSSAQCPGSVARLACFFRRRRPLHGALPPSPVLPPSAPVLMRGLCGVSAALRGVSHAALCDAAILFQMCLPTGSVACPTHVKCVCAQHVSHNNIAHGSPIQSTRAARTRAFWQLLATIHARHLWRQHDSARVMAPSGLNAHRRGRKGALTSFEQPTLCLE